MRYAEAWRKRRRLRNNFLLCWLGGPVLFVVVMGVGSLLLGLFAVPRDRTRGFDDAVFWVVGVGWVASTLFWGLRLFHGFTCPRCQRLFYLTGRQGIPLTGRCLNCGLNVDAAEPFVARAGAVPLRLPLFIQGRDLRVFACVGDAEKHLMRAEVWADEGFDRAGLRLQFQQWARWGLFGWTSERVLLEAGEAQPTGQARLKALLQARLRTGGASLEWLERASLDELVEEAARVPPGGRS